MRGGKGKGREGNGSWLKPPQSKFSGYVAAPNERQRDAETAEVLLISLIN